MGYYYYFCGVVRWVGFLGLSYNKIIITTVSRVYNSYSHRELMKPESALVSHKESHPFSLIRVIVKLGYRAVVNGPTP